MAGSGADQEGAAPGGGVPRDASRTGPRWPNAVVGGDCTDEGGCTREGDRPAAGAGLGAGVPAGLGGGPVAGGEGAGATAGDGAAGGEEPGSAHAAGGSAGADRRGSGLDGPVRQATGAGIGRAPATGGCPPGPLGGP
ncbi:hypothetical protein [Candidatus Frankia nodulisporulans]|uniref:hypothetical protein n=1 Tax=Candidatus Frankia nodulisporulans TaxID=2060052 RepID=UPI0013D21F8B|nr:hypothetical protein [Candidatus Frankia nodulisporulans]